MTDAYARRSLLPTEGQTGTEYIENYLARGGYATVRQAIAQMTSSPVVAAVDRAGLGGRGSDGFAVARKWQAALGQNASEVYVVADAYDADPEAPIARALLERNPHAVLEGLALAAYAVGAREVFFYLNSNSAVANRRLRAAIAEAEEHGVLGESAFDGHWPVIVRSTVGWGGFAGGEDTAALEAIEGKRAMPRQKPPYPTEAGLWGRPTVVHSVETLANLPGVVAGAQPGNTKLLVIGGDAARPGIYEVPFGTTLRQIVFDLGGGAANGRGVRLVQVGGPTGAILPESLLDTPLDHEALAQVGAFVGSGSIKVLADDTCAVDYARERMTYLSQEACGKCVPCRLGTQRMAATLEGIVSGLGRKTDVDLIQEFATVMAEGSLCGFGMTAPAVLRSTLAHFGEDYRVHIEEGRCPTGRCQPLRTRRFERKTAV
ncbi:MAG: complex I 51 kDa subunit family protein [Chloroflexota bacterium]